MKVKYKIKNYHGGPDIDRETEYEFGFELEVKKYD